MSDQARCIACGEWRPPGALLRVVPVDPRHAEFVTCRPGLGHECHALAGPRSQTIIGLVDDEAADAFDRARAAINRGAS